MSIIRNIRVQMNHAPLFYTGQVLTFPSGQWKFLDATRVEGGMYVNNFVEVSTGDVKTLTDEKFASMFVNRIVQAVMTTGKEREQYQMPFVQSPRQEILVNNKVFNLYSLMDELAPEYQRHTPKEQRRTVSAAEAFSELRKKQDLVHALMVLWLHDRFGSNYGMNRKEVSCNSCRGCSALIFHRPDDENGYIGGDDSREFKNPYYCGYTGYHTDERGTEYARQDSLRGDVPDIHYNQMLAGCGKYTSLREEWSSVYLERTLPDGSKAFRFPGYRAILI